MSFRFRLQKVLDLRAEAEQACARALASASARVERCAEALRAVEQVQREQAAHQHATLQAGATAGSAQQQGWVLAQLQLQIEVAREALREAEAAERDAQAALALAAKERRVLARLQERHHEAWKLEESARERVRMDEVALTRFARSTETPAAGTSTAP